MGINEVSRRFSLALALVAGLFVMSGCTHAPQAPATPAEGDADAAPADHDPLEGFNRVMYKINYGLDYAILRPVTVGYRYVVPERGRVMVSNFVENIYSPVVFVNSVLQADPQNSFATLWRFLINSTVGVAGLFDPASGVGLHNRPADLGETLAFYGVNGGPYLYLPIIGPSNFRDATGRLGDAFIDPINYASNWVWISAWSITAVDARSNNTKLIDNVYDSSLDPYATFRSLYMQKRAADIKRAEEMREKSLENNGAKD